jgi:hypothetical protein
MVTPSAGASANGAPGQGAATGGAARQQRNSQQRNGGNRGRFQMPQPKKFAGKEEGLGDEHVHQHTEGRDATDQHSLTTEEIIRCTSRKCKNGGDVEPSLSDGVAIVFPMPPCTMILSVRERWR